MDFQSYWKVPTTQILSRYANKTAGLALGRDSVLKLFVHYVTLIPKQMFIYDAVAVEAV